MVFGVELGAALDELVHDVDVVALHGAVQGTLGGQYIEHHTKPRAHESGQHDCARDTRLIYSRDTSLIYSRDTRLIYSRDTRLIYSRGTRLIY